MLLSSSDAGRPAKFAFTIPQIASGSDTRVGASQLSGCGYPAEVNGQTFGPCRAPESNWPRVDNRPIEIASVHLPSKTRSLFGDFQEPSRVRAVESSGFMERAMGIEPTSEAWEASIKVQKRSNWRHFDVFRVDSNWSSVEVTM